MYKLLPSTPLVKLTLPTLVVAERAKRACPQLRHLKLRGDGRPLRLSERLPLGRRTCIHRGEHFAVSCGRSARTNANTLLVNVTAVV